MFRRSVCLAATTTVLHAVFCSIYLPHTYPELPQPLFTSEQALGAHPIDSIKTKHDVKGKGCSNIGASVAAKKGAELERLKGVELISSYAALKLMGNNELSEQLKVYKLVKKQAHLYAVWYLLYPLPGILAYCCLLSTD